MPKRQVIEGTKRVQKGKGKKTGLGGEGEQKRLEESEERENRRG